MHAVTVGEHERPQSFARSHGPGCNGLQVFSLAGSKFVHGSIVAADRRVFLLRRSGDVAHRILRSRAKPGSHDPLFAWGHQGHRLAEHGREQP